MTTQPKGIKVDSMKLIQLLGNAGLLPHLQNSQQPFQASEECHLLAGAGNLKMFWGTHSNLQVLQASLVASYLVCLLALGDY